VLYPLSYEGGRALMAKSSAVGKGRPRAGGTTGRTRVTDGPVRCALRRRPEASEPSLHAPDRRGQFTPTGEKPRKNPLASGGWSVGLAPAT
jgi:hypothetical protein